MRAQFLLALLGHAAAQNLVALLNGAFEELDGAAPGRRAAAVAAAGGFAVAISSAGAPADDDGSADDDGGDDDGGGQWRLMAVMGTSPCCVLWTVESFYRE